MPAKVYLKPKEFVRRSRHHTAYMGNGAVQKQGEESPIYKIQFFNGVATNVPENVFKRAQDVGVADSKRPNLDRD